ncbi:MAG: hypothetical protein OHK93_005825 [Ramalina farinacea]|uniref:Heterokaryon incompatibility domain-containing protein n=1 Tax=Ramalina farinacea TaxID=258253 RepID=A0AA43QKW6_9LECA|nr:hypothetical protein [Ramalina farinacea]
MRLINVKTRMFDEFVGADIPPYAILSHTWGVEEVTFPLYAKPESRLLKGYEKIEQSCRLAAEYNLVYVWIDTCCIDKSSSAELSEAINSMYHWYKSAEVCFVYLFDFEAYEKYESHYQDSKSPYESDPALRRFNRCKWFSRGWTLQEMLAPNAVEFFDTNWKFFGEKHDMISLHTFITKIASEFFDNAQTASVAQKFSWAAHRETTRVEDIAYCLLGLFDINMPLLYGEGEKAFKRLQLEILRSSDDESIFAWTDKSLWASGILATSPSNFADSGRIVPLRDLTLYRSPYQMTHQGLQIELESFTRQKHTGTPFEAYLRCFHSDDRNERPENLVALLIEPLEILPRVTRARRVLPGKIKFRKCLDIQKPQEGGNFPDSAQKSSILIQESRMPRQSRQLVEKNYTVSGNDLNPNEHGKWFLHSCHDGGIKPSDIEQCSDGRDYVYVAWKFFAAVKRASLHSYEFHAVIIRLPRPACKPAHLELFFFPFISYPEWREGVISQRIDCHEMLRQIQTGQLEPYLLCEGDQFVHQLSSFADMFIALGPPSTTDTKRFELEMQLDLV